MKERNFYKAAFIPTVRRPRGTAYVSSHVDTDTSLPWHLMFCLIRRESQEIIKIGGMDNVNQGMLFLCPACLSPAVGVGLKKAEGVLKYFFHCFSGKGESSVSVFVKVSN